MISQEDKFYEFISRIFIGYCHYATFYKGNNFITIRYTERPIWKNLVLIRVPATDTHLKELLDFESSECFPIVLFFNTETDIIVKRLSQEEKPLTPNEIINTYLDEAAIYELSFGVHDLLSKGESPFISVKFQEIYTIVFFYSVADRDWLIYFTNNRVTAYLGKLLDKKNRIRMFTSYLKNNIDQILAEENPEEFVNKNMNGKLL